MPYRQALRRLQYADIAKHCEQLTYRDKLRPAQLLIQTGRKEEEEQNPARRDTETTSGASDPELIQYVADRLRKLRPAKRVTLLNSIGAMFQFQGGISDGDKEKFLPELVKHHHLDINKNNRVSYPAVS